MAHVLLIIAIFTTSQGIASDTRFHEFANQPACEAARADVTRGVSVIKGQIGRDVFAACYAKGSASAKPH